MPTPASTSPGSTPSGRPSTTPFMRTLYLQEQGAWLRASGGRFLLTAPGDAKATLLSVPITKIDQIMVFGACHLSPATLHRCLSQQIPITLLSSRGQYYGRIESTEAVNIQLQRLQFTKSDDSTFKLELARRFVQGKIANAKTLLLRRRKRASTKRIKKAVRQLKRAGRRLHAADTLDEVRGFEGAASAAYFGVFDAMLHAPGMRFDRRMKRPPPDPVNALLSFGYTLLFYNIFSMVRHHRLTPYVGVLHAERPGHPALVSDLIEEFRPLIDSMVLGLLNRKRLRPADFYRAETSFGSRSNTGKRAGGCFLKDEARKAFIHRFEQLMEREVTDPPSGRVLTYRKMLDLQVRRFIDHLRGKPIYAPFQWR